MFHCPNRITLPLALGALALGSPSSAQSFGPQQVIAAGIPGARCVHAVDLDLDGVVDIVSAHEDEGSIYWHRNTGAAVFSMPILVTNEAQCVRDLAIADFDADGFPDIASASPCDDKIAWYRNLSGASFGPQEVLSGFTDGASAIEAADINNDGQIDLLGGLIGVGRVLFWPNHNGVFTSPVTVGESSPNLRSIEAVDIDGDGDLDVMTANFGDNTVKWYPQTGGGSFSSAQPISVGVPSTFKAIAGQFGPTSNTDVALVSVDSGDIHLALAFAPGQFAGPIQVMDLPNQGWDVQAADLDQDGDLDLVGSSSADIYWAEQTQPGFYNGQELVFHSVSASPVFRETTAADLDGDGDLDLVSASSSDGTVAWYENLLSSPDCNGNGVADAEDISSGTSQDCNANGIPDECDIAAGLEFDCNLNGIPDACDLLAGTSLDCDANGVPDECDITAGAADCNADGIPDVCQIAADTTLDLNTNGTLDACEAIGAPYCSPAVANSTGLPGVVTILGNETVFLNDFKVSARQLPASAFGYFIASTTPGSVFPVANSVGTLCVIGSVGRGVGGGIVNSGPDGYFYGNVNLNAMPQPVGTVMVQPGDTWHFQAWHRDASGGQTTSNFTDAVAVTFQ